MRATGGSWLSGNLDPDCSLCYIVSMPKLHDLCQQFWEELSGLNPPGGQTLSPEALVLLVEMKLQKDDPQRAGIIARHLLALAKELNIQTSIYDIAYLNEHLEGIFG